MRGFLILLFVAMACGRSLAQPLLNPAVAQVHDGGTVRAVVVQPDGKVIIGGSFTHVHGTARRNIARLNADLTLDTSWNPDADGTVHALALEAGQLYMGGAFFRIGGQVKPYLAKVPIAGNGAPDGAWNPSASSQVEALALDGAGALYAGGWFTQVGGVSRDRLVKVATATGVVDPTWNPGANGIVVALAHAPGSVYAGGVFSSAGGQSRSRIARLAAGGAGTADATWNPSPDGNVQALATDGGGNVYVGGTFANIGGFARNRIARLSGTGAGAADATWNPNADGTVLALQPGAGAAVYASGDFLNIGGRALRGVARLSTSGTGAADAAFNPDTIAKTVYALALGAAGELYAGGGFQRHGTRVQGGFASLDAASGASRPQSVVVLQPGTVHAIAVDGAGRAVIGGSFIAAGDFTPRSNLARFNPDHSLDTGWNPGADGTVRAIAATGPGVTYVGGEFTSVGGQARFGLAKIGVPGDVLAGWAPSASTVLALLLDGTGGVIAGGSFFTIGGVTRPGVALIGESTGTVSLAWNANVLGTVNALALDGGSLYIGGSLYQAGGVPRSRLAKVAVLNGALDASWNPAPDGDVTALAADGAGSLFAGGSFANLGGQARPRLAKLTTSGTGTADAQWNPAPEAAVWALAATGGNVYVGGYFSTVAGQARPYLTRMPTTGAGVPDPLWKPEADSIVLALAMAGANVHVGGQFRSIAAKARAGYGVLGPFQVPSAPAITAVHTGDTQVALVLDRGTVDGGLTLTFHATCNPGNFTASSKNRVVGVRGLANGTTYSCTGHLSNASGTGPVSAPASVTPAPANIGGLGRSMNGRPYIADVTAFLKTCPDGDPATAEILASMRITQSGVPIPAEPCTAPVDIDAQPSPRLWALQMLRVAYYMDPGAAGLYPWTAGTYWDWLRSVVGTIEADPALTQAAGYCCVPAPGEPLPQMVLQLPQPGVSLFFSALGRLIGLVTHEARHGEGHFHVACTATSGSCDAEYNVADLSAYGVAWWVSNLFTTGQINVGLGCTEPGRQFASGQVGFQNGLQNQFNGAKPPLVTVPAEPGGPCRLAATLALEPPALAFGGHSMRTTLLRQVTVRNPSSSQVIVTSIAASAGFSVTHDCGTLAAGATCTATVGFTPTGEGAVSGTLTVTGGAGATASLSGTGERSLVSHYYRSILRRDPDAGGKSYWETEAARLANLGANVNEAWFAMAMTFYNSAEYLAFNRNPTEFVRDLYNTFFNRAADDGGLAYWTGQVTSGMPREILLASFMFSSEFTSFSQAIFGNTGARAEVDVVVDFYRGLLSRLPDNGGFNFWVGRFRSAQCQGAAAVVTQVEAISSAFVLSAEYSARARTPTQYVGDLYNAFLRRGGDLAGVQYWIGQVTTGARTREQVRREFLVSPEFSARVTRVLQEGCLQ